MLKVIKLVVIMGLMHCGFTSSRVISTLYALDHQESAWVVGAILSAYSLIPALIAIHVGKWIDKVGVKLPFGIAASMVGSASLVPVFLPYESFGIWPVFITCLLAGTGFLFALISGQGLIGVLSTNKTRATAFTYQSIAFSLSGSAGPVMAGYFIDLGSFSYAYLAAFSFATVGGLAFFLLSSNFPKKISNISKLKRTEKHSALELFALKPVRNVLIASAFVSMAWDLQAFMIPVYGTEIGLDAVQIGWLLSAFSISTFAAFGQVLIADVACRVGHQQNLLVVCCFFCHICSPIRSIRIWSACPHFAVRETPTGAAPHKPPPPPYSRGSGCVPPRSSADVRSIPDLHGEVPRGAPGPPGQIQGRCCPDTAARYRSAVLWC